MRRGYLRSRGLCLDPVFQSSGGQQHRGEPGVDSGIGERVDGWVTAGALGCSGGRGRWGRGGRLFCLQDFEEKEKDQSSRTAVETKGTEIKEISPLWFFPL